MPLAFTQEDFFVGIKNTLGAKLFIIFEFIVNICVVKEGWEN